MSDTNKAGIIGDLHIQSIKLSGEMWTEEYKSTLIHMMLSRYKTEIIRTHGISDIIINGDKVLIKWFHRIHPLTDEELMEHWGREQKKKKTKIKINKPKQDVKKQSRRRNARRRE